MAGTNTEYKQMTYLNMRQYYILIDPHMNTAQSNAEQSLCIQMIYKGGTQILK